MPISEHVRGMRSPAWGTSGVRMVSAWNARIGTCHLHALWCGRGGDDALARDTGIGPGAGTAYTRYGVHRIYTASARNSHARTMTDEENGDHGVTFISTSCSARWTGVGG